MGATPSCTHKISPRTHRLQTQPCTRLLGAGPRAMSIWPQPSSKLRGAAATFLPMTIALARSDEHAAVDVLDPTLAAKRHGDLEVGEDAFDDLLNSLLPAQSETPHPWSSKEHSVRADCRGERSPPSAAPCSDVLPRRLKLLTSKSLDDVGTRP